MYNKDTILENKKPEIVLGEKKQNNKKKKNSKSKKINNEEIA